MDPKVPTDGQESNLNVTLKPMLPGKESSEGEVLLQETLLVCDIPNGSGVIFPRHLVEKLDLRPIPIKLTHESLQLLQQGGNYKVSIGVKLD